MSIVRTIGSLSGSAAAYAVHGTMLASTQLAEGAREGYAATSADLIARRQAALAGRAPVAAPAQRKLKVPTA